MNFIFDVPYWQFRSLHISKAFNYTILSFIRLAVWRRVLHTREKYGASDGSLLRFWLLLWHAPTLRPCCEHNLFHALTPLSRDDDTSPLNSSIFYHPETGPTPHQCCTGTIYTKSSYILELKGNVITVCPTEMNICPIVPFGVWIGRENEGNKGLRVCECLLECWYGTKPMWY